MLIESPISSEYNTVLLTICGFTYNRFNVLTYNVFGSENTYCNFRKTNFIVHDSRLTSDDGPRVTGAADDTGGQASDVI